MRSGGESVSQIDIELTGYLDGELAPEARRALEQRLAADATLRARLEALEAARPAADAFALLLAAAPTDRLAASLRTATAVAPPPARRWGRFAAAAAVLLVVGAAVGFAVARFAVPAEVEVAAEPPGWRAVVADYLDLYTDETLAAIPDDPALRSAELANAGAKLALDLTPEKVALPDMTLKRTQLLDFRGLPLAQIAYRSAADGPVALCIIANGKPDIPRTFEQRHGWNIEFWNADGIGYMVIGKVPPETIQALAATLESRAL